ncbi:MAG: RNA methyltransferase [Defluviitaleaceae bacterium]|nr:RNA methyltransferase [Defluviitaleaceae bacterium]
MCALKDLQSKKGRDESGLFLVEGEKFIAEIPESYEIGYYVVSRNFADTHDLSPYKKRARCEIIRDSLFKKLADTVTPQGIIAVCEKIPYKLDDILQKDGFFLMGECLSDPGNIGTLVRTAAAAGASGALFTEGCCDVYSPKVLRAAAGAVLRLPIVANISVDKIYGLLKNAGIPVFAAHPRGNALPYDLNFRDKFCLLIGNESHGISKNAETNADALVRLPMTDDTESLNASVAGSILLYEAVRQRRSEGLVSV